VNSLINNWSDLGLGVMIFIIWYFEGRRNRNYEQLIKDYRGLAKSQQGRERELINVIKENIKVMTSLREIIKNGVYHKK